MASIDYHRYLRDLNPGQRRAVQFGIDDDNRSPSALLIAAGAGTGKTQTLAHRVAYLILNGADPHRLLLLTFTRRAALEMTRRAHRILAEARGDGADRALPQTAILPWSGTFHSVGSRLLRLHALSIGLDPSFTILDRSDSADLLDLVRTELGLSRTASRFPRKDTCLAIYSYTVNAGCPLEETLAQSFPWCAHWPNELRRLFEAYVVAKQRESVLDYDDLLLYWRHAMAETIVATEIRGCFDHILVDGTRIPIGSKPRSCWRCAPTGPVSQSSATMRNRSIRSARQPFGTFWTFHTISPHPPRSSRSSAIIVRPSRSSMLRTR